MSAQPQTAVAAVDAVNGGPADVPPWRAVRARWGRQIAVAAVLLGGMAAAGHFVGGMLGWWNLYKAFNTVAPTKVGAKPGAKAHSLSLVMLPLNEDGPTQAGDGFADVLTSDVTSALGQLTGMLVISRDTAFTYKGKSVDPREISRELAVRYVLRGSVRREGDDVRLQLAVIDGETGLQHWAQQFTMKRAQLDAGLQDVSAQIGRSLSIEVVKAAGKRTAGLMPEEVAADDIAIRGWGIYFQGFTKDNLREALGLFEQAVVRDPKSVRAWGGIGLLNGSMAFLRWADDREAAVRRVEEAAQKLQGLDQDDPMTYMVHGWVSNLRNDFPGMLRAAEGMLARYPQHPQALNLKAVALTTLGRTDECVEPSKQALRVGPRDVSAGFWHVQLGLCHFIRGEYAQAAESARAAHVATPSLGIGPALGAAALFQMGKVEEARISLDEFRRLRPKSTSEDVARICRGNHEKCIATRKLLKEAMGHLGLT